MFLLKQICNVMLRMFFQPYGWRCLTKTAPITMMRRLHFFRLSFLLLCFLLRCFLLFCFLRCFLLYLLFSFLLNFFSVLDFLL